MELFVFAGEIDDWKNHFTVEDNEAFDTIYSERMANSPELKSLIQFH